MKRYILALFAVTLLLVSCGEKEEEVAVTSVTLTQATAEMLIGETVQLTATVLPSNSTEKIVLWASSKQSVATVSNSGLVTALAEGTSTITASCGGKTATCQVTVSKGFVEVTSVSLNKEELTLIKGQSETLVATVNPSDATDKTVTWDSSDKGVVSVDANGKVTAVAGGITAISAKAGDKQTTCSVTVTVPVESISLDQDNITLKEEQSITLVATVKPDDATDKTVTWSSSDNQIATVDESGKVTAIFIGAATITAKIGDKQAICTVSVKEASPEAVDLGLSVKWASFNLGAAKPEEYGDYYAWGETETKSDYSWATYKWWNGSENTLTKYNTQSDYGTVDNKTTLDPEDDVAATLLGGKWRIPTDEEWTELRDNCTWTWTTQNGVNGSLFTGLNGNTIFLPAPGFWDGATLIHPGGIFGFYWSSSLNTRNSINAMGVNFGSVYVSRVNYYRYSGQSVRPVLAE